MSEVVVAFTVSGLREKYLRRALDSWAQVRGIANVQLVFCIEPAHTFPFGEFTGWAMRIFREPLVRQNTEQLGCLRNTRQAFSTAFAAGARLAVLAEEDLVVSADVLEYLNWAMGEYEQDPEIAAVCAHARESKSRDEEAVVRVPWFNPLVCGTWKDRWENVIEPSWGAWDEGVEGNQAWDNNLRIVLRQAGYKCVFPAMSRVLHVGETSTIYGSAVVGEYMYAQSISTCFRPDHHPAVHREVPFASVPGLLV